MDPASIWFLGTTLLLAALFVALVARTCGKRREKVEAPKYRMMNDD